MPALKFKDLLIGQQFEFTNTLKPGYGTVRGPWFKVSARTYRSAYGPPIQVGSTGVQVTLVGDQDDHAEDCRCRECRGDWDA